jgi:hypothetical protein
MNMWKEVNKMTKMRDSGLCPACGKDTAKEIYKDEASKREAKITGYCQPCMDKIFDSFKEKK